MPAVTFDDPAPFCSTLLFIWLPSVKATYYVGCTPHFTLLTGRCSQFFDLISATISTENASDDFNYQYQTLAVLYFFSIFYFPLLPVSMCKLNIAILLTALWLATNEVFTQKHTIQKYEI